MKWWLQSLPMIHPPTHMVIDDEWARLDVSECQTKLWINHVFPIRTRHWLSDTGMVNLTIWQNKGRTPFRKHSYMDHLPSLNSRLHSELHLPAFRKDIPCTFPIDYHRVYAMSGGNNNCTDIDSPFQPSLVRWRWDRTCLQFQIDSSKFPVWIVWWHSEQSVFGVLVPSFPLNHHAAMTLLVATFF